MQRRARIESLEDRKLFSVTPSAPVALKLQDCLVSSWSIGATNMGSAVINTDFEFATPGRIVATRPVAIDRVMAEWSGPAAIVGRYDASTGVLY